MGKTWREIFKFLLFISLSIFALFYFADFGKSDSYKILEVVSGDTFYVDLNKDGKKGEDELVKLNLVKTFSSNLDKIPHHILKIYDLSLVEAEYLGKIAHKFSNEKLKNKTVEIKNIKTTKNISYGTIYLNGEDFAKTLLSEGLAYSYNPKYFDSYFKFENRDKIYSHIKNYDLKTPSSSNIKIIFIEPNYSTLPSKLMKTKAGEEIINSINKAKESIYFALYGVSGQDELFDALINAKNRGVEIKGVFDSDEYGKSIYDDYQKYSKHFDIISDSNSALMHNKFFIIDDKTVLTGSMNLSSTGSGGYNTNTLLKINSKEVALIYKKEFDQMRQGKFQKIKEKLSLENISLNSSKISVYFSPNIAIERKICSLVENAKSEILVSAFYLTNQNIANSLILAKQNGAKIYIVLDAVGASNPKSKHKILRNAGIKLKVENYGGKNHEKNILIDNKILISGSSNFSKSGYARNDENTLIITDFAISKNYREHFFKLYNSIDNIYLMKNPKAESKESINSCFDKIDNDFDGKIDKFDSACR